MGFLARNNGPDYSLCDQSVTVYRRATDGTLTTTVIGRAFLDFKKVRTVEKTGSKDALSFLLVVPGDADIRVGDRVLLGVGEEVSIDAEWRSLIPAKVEGLCVVAYVDRKYFNGQLVHVEAGG